MSKLDDINEVVESLFRSGTRYRSEKFVVLAAYLAVVGMSIAWAAVGLWKTQGLEAMFESSTIENIGDTTFALDNVGAFDWHDVRIALEDRYLMRLERLEADAPEKTLGPSDFKYYFHIPRPWGTARWERLEERPKPPSGAPSDLELESGDIDIHTREGRVDVRFERK